MLGPFGSIVSAVLVSLATFALWLWASDGHLTPAGSTAAAGVLPFVVASVLCRGGLGRRLLVGLAAAFMSAVSAVVVAVVVVFATWNAFD